MKVTFGCSMRLCWMSDAIRYTFNSSMSACFQCNVFATTYATFQLSANVALYCYTLVPALHYASCAALCKFLYSTSYNLQRNTGQLLLVSAKCISKHASSQATSNHD